MKTIEYIVENLGNKETTAIATFAYFPKEFRSYIRKLNCFCYDAQSLKSKQKSLKSNLNLNSRIPETRFDNVML